MQKHSISNKTIAHATVAWRSYTVAELLNLERRPFKVQDNREAQPLRATSTKVRAMSTKASMLLLCSTETYNVPHRPIINSIKTNLHNQFNVTTWKDNIVFRPTDTTASIERFLQSMYTFDAVILLFTADDIRKINGHEEHVVRDNLIFELGACMAHFGPQRTYVMMPEGGVKITLPSYLRDYTPLLWDQTGNAIGDASVACGHIGKMYESTKYKFTDIGLPAMSSANSYYNAYLDRLIDHFMGATSPDNCDCRIHEVLKVIKAFKVYIIIDERVVCHSNANVNDTSIRFYKQNEMELSRINTVNHRPLDIKTKIVDNTLIIVDVPTIIQGFKTTLKELNYFWGSRGDDNMNELILKKEIEKFGENVKKLSGPRQYIEVIKDIDSIGLVFQL